MFLKNRIETDNFTFSFQFRILNGMDPVHISSLLCFPICNRERAVLSYQVETGFFLLTSWPVKLLLALKPLLSTLPTTH